VFFFFSSRRRHTRFSRDWSSDVCSSDLQPRTGENSVTGQPTLAPEADGWTLNGHEYHVPNNGDLQYACVFQIPERDCLTAIPGRSEERRVGKGCRSRRSA